ncbi:Decaprenyl-diphosphate synthase subunit 1 [Lucilia cuprina]|nr:Decaprenyl-diphosphate synthase subunit 1 [Lucilia cuprina]
MACLSTSGRQGLFVAVGSRRYHNQRFLCQLMLQQQENNHRKNLGGSMANTKCSTATSRLLSCTTSASLSNAPLHFQQPKRYFHGFNKNTTTTTTTATSVFNLMHNSPTATTNSKTKCSNLKTNCRHYSSVHTQQPAGPVREIQIDPYIILDDELKYFYDDVRDLLAQGTSQAELDKIATYYFDGQGKALRPMVTMLMSKAINYHLNKESRQLLHKQRQIALFSEMVHSASLVHDDVIDQSDFRRGKPSVNVLWNHKKILTDLVQGEFMQLGSRETENERFAHYLTKTYRKTASLIANTLKATAVIAEADENMTELAFQYGRNIGLAFQLVDDMLDFVSSTETMGKPTAADLKLGLATAPVLFACEKYPELNPMIMRRFGEPGDVERAFELVHKSHGLEQTRFLAKKHCIEAIRLAQEMTESPYQKGLQVVADLVINRMK